MELASKEGIRQMIWDYLETNNLAAFPRPVHHRIPNFKGAPAACDRLKSMDSFQKARTVKINPDKPQQQARFMTLEARKTLLVPTPRLRTGLFNRIEPPPGANKEMLRTCASSQGVRQYSSPLGLDAKVKIDLVVIGSVAVSSTGYRIGKGEGYADMEFSMMSSMGAISEDTVVITTVHDCQVRDDIPEHLFGEHDLGVDYILTPTRTIKCDNRRAKPKGIAWHLLTREKFGKIPVLKILRMQEAKLGKDVRLQDEVTVDCDERAVDSPPAARIHAQHNHTSNINHSSVTQPGEKARHGDRTTGRSKDRSIRTDRGAHCTVGVEAGKTRGSAHRDDLTSGSGQSMSMNPKLSSNRRRDLDSMFAWSKNGK